MIIHSDVKNEADDPFSANPESKPIRVYDEIDTRMSISDLFAKLSLCYGG